MYWCCVGRLLQDVQRYYCDDVSWVLICTDLQPVYCANQPVALNKYTELVKSNEKLEEFLQVTLIVYTLSAHHLCDRTVTKIRELKGWIYLLISLNL